MRIRDSKAAFPPCLALGLLAICAGACGDGDSAQIHVGAAVADITPEAWPLPLVGSFSYRPATSAHDPLHARALVVRSRETTVAIAVVDSCYIPRSVLDEAKGRVHAATGLATDRMLISATHTHSAPPPAPGLGLRGLESEQNLDLEEQYAERLVRGIASSITAAHARLQPAEVGWGTAPLPDEVFNRRWFMREGTIPPDPFGGTTDRVRMNPPRGSPDLIRPAGPVDPEVAVLSFRASDGEPLAILANYSLHYVGGIPAGQVSADYFGEFARVLSERLEAGDNFVAVLSNGTSANVNNLNFAQPRKRKEPFEQVRHVASKVADTVLGIHGSIDHRSEAEVAMAQEELGLALRKPTPEILAQSQRMIADPPEGANARQIIYAQRAVDLHNGPDAVGVVLQAMRIGDIGIAALPFETFVETGLALKRQSPMKPSFVIELANGAEKYLPTPEHHELGGYETWLGTNVVERQASVKVEQVLLQLLQQVAPGEG